MDSVREIVERHGKKEAGLIAMMQDLQKEMGYLPKEGLETIAEEVGVPMTRLYSLATFYHAFSLTPRGKYTLNVCTGTACHVRGASKLMEKLERDLKVEEGGTTEDGKYTLQGVRCVGCCGLAPVMVVDENFHGKLSQKDLDKVLKNYQ